MKSEITCKHANFIARKSLKPDQQCSPSPRFPSTPATTKANIKAHRQNIPKILEAHINVWARKHAYGTLQNFQLYPKSGSFSINSNEFGVKEPLKRAVFQTLRIRMGVFGKHVPMSKLSFHATSKLYWIFRNIHLAATKRIQISEKDAC